MKSKLFLTVLCALICLFALVTAVCAEEYTVYSSEEFKTAFNSATDGDTIVIKADITGELEFGKSITYIIDGNYTWLAGGRANDTGKTVSIYARNGNGVFMPNAAMWMNSYESDVTVKLTETVWNFGALDSESTITFDLTKVVSRLFYDVWFKEINFKCGTEITRCNNSSQNDTRYFRASTINIYDGASIHEVYVAPYRGFFECTTLNIYGGEIYNCYFTEYGMVLASTVNMYGGKIHDVYLNFTNTGVTEGIFNNINLNMYGGEICDNYVKAASTGAHSILAGNKHLVGGSVHNNYVFTSWPATPTKDANGVYSIAGLDITQGTEAGNGVRNTTVYDYSVIFKNQDGSVIVAYLVGQGKLKSTVADATEVSVPRGYAWSSVFGSCVSVTPDTTKQGTYYVLSDHTPKDDDFDCTTALSCSVCQSVIYEANAHAVKESLTYQNLCAPGVYAYDCTNPGCSVNDLTKEYAPLVKMLGYSVTEPAAFGKISMVQSFYVNVEVLDAYNEINKTTLTFGVVAASEAFAEANPLYVENGQIMKANEEKVILHSASTTVHEIKIIGIDPENELHTSTRLVWCGFAFDGEKIVYIDNGSTYENAPLRSYAEIIS